MKYVLSAVDSGPLSMRARRETAGAETRTYVPGTTVLGALAAAHLQGGRSSAEFNAFFGPASRFSNLYPASFDADDLKGLYSTPVYPLPATAVSCKRFGGFRHDQDLAEDDPHHGVYDTAAAGTLFALAEIERQSRPQPQPPARLELLSVFDYCRDVSGRGESGRGEPGCKEPMDRFEGYYRRDLYNPTVVGSVQVSRGLRTRAGISRLTGAVEQGILYSREVLNAGTAYWGTAEVPDACAAQFAEFVEEISDGGLLRLGNNRTRGFGALPLSVQPPPPAAVDTVDTLLARMKAFDAHVRSRERGLTNRAKYGLYVSITLTSDAVLLDRLLRYRTRLDGDYLREECRIDGAELLLQSGGTRRVMGWNLALGVPKADETAITMGAVFVFGLDKPLERDTAAQFLAVQEAGVGVRRREGFGQLVVASPFHYEVNGI